MPDALQAALFLCTMMLGMGGMATLIMRARHLYGAPSLRNRLLGSGDSDVRMAALRTYEKLASEKLDVVRRALDLGWGDAELKALDARLEQLVGRESLERIASGDVLSRDLETATGSPEQELAKLRRASSD
jgi:hypothetical protein